MFCKRILAASRPIRFTGCETVSNEVLFMAGKDENNLLPA